MFLTNTLTAAHSHVHRLLYAHTRKDIPKLPPNIHGRTIFYRITTCRVPCLQLHPVRPLHCELR